MKRTKDKNVFIIMSIAFVIVFFSSFALGRYSVNIFTSIKILLSRIFPLSQTWNSSDEVVILKIRLPRIIAAVFIGASLSLSGLVYQGLFQNPMVSPDILGSSSGAGFMAALAILLKWNYSLVTLSSFIGGILSVTLVLFIASRVKGVKMLSLVLSGIMISSLFTSLISFVKLVADTDNALPQITYFLMGSLSSISQTDLYFLMPITIVGIAIILFLCWPLNVMTQGDEEARALGVNTKIIRYLTIFSATLLTSATVAVAGLIGWVGLVIPHLTRMLIGCDYRKTIPLSILMGSTFLLLVDTVSRNISPMEIPLGILTSFIGAPFFIYLIIREGRKL